MDNEEKFHLITRNLQEIIGEEELREKLNSNIPLTIYWGTAPTGSVSIAYFFPMLKIADFLNAGVNVKILIADLHAALDGVPWDLINKRYEYYKLAIKDILKTLGVDISKLEFIKGSEMQLDSKYIYDLLKLSCLTSVQGANKAASEVVKGMDNPKVSGLVYPLMQAIDEEYLRVDAQFGGVDQRKIMVFAREMLPKIGYRPRIELMNPMIRGLVGEKMSSSIKASKIGLLDDEEEVKKKINNADCTAGDPENGILALLKYFIFIYKVDREESFKINRPEKFGGDLEYTTYSELESDFIEKRLHPQDLKMAVSMEINSILENFRKDENLKNLYNLAYGEE